MTVGGYGVVADQDSGDLTFFGKKGGVLLGYEQPLGGNVSFVADWFSGKNYPRLLHARHLDRASP